MQALSHLSKGNTQHARVYIYSMYIYAYIPVCTYMHACIDIYIHACIDTYIHGCKNGSHKGIRISQGRFGRQKRKTGEAGRREAEHVTTAAGALDTYFGRVGW